MTQPLETDVNLTIRHKKLIPNILVSIPVTHENKLHVNYFARSFPSTVNTVIHSYYISVFIY
jgi:hypothetical protein